jgi:DNA-binding NarL/FixJ family response regulator
MIRVLVVDDVKDLRLLFRQILAEDEEISVIGEAADGIEAIEQARLLQPDVVILDLAMPRLDGLRAMPGLREAAPDTKILVLSAFSSRDLSSRVIRACATAMIDKGASISKLRRTVHDVHDAPPKTGCDENTA